METTPIANRISIALFGKRNVGKSSLINAITNQTIAVTSEVAGTTTDPVYKTMELLPLGPVVFIDTAGLDDDSQLGVLRIEKTYEVLRKTDLAILVLSAIDGITSFEQQFVQEVKQRNIPVIGVINKIDQQQLDPATIAEYSTRLSIPFAAVSAVTGQGMDHLKQLMIQHAPTDDAELSLVSGLISPGSIAVLVTPIDKAAPKGRLILPQQQTIRDILECDAITVVTKEHELKRTLESLSVDPAIVITDSQAFLKVAADTPQHIPMTSFSILFARQKGNLVEMVKGLRRIETLKHGDRVLIAEGCTHHRQSDDIGRVKIPRWIRQITGCDIHFAWTSGTAYPDDIDQYAVIIHCGGCMLNRREMHYRIEYARSHGVAITNYGMVIAYVQGILHRALQPFPAAALALDHNVLSHPGALPYP